MFLYKKECNNWCLVIGAVRGLRYHKKAGTLIVPEWPLFMLARNGLDTPILCIILQLQQQC